jgi:hypothetical protein
MSNEVWVTALRFYTHAVRVRRARRYANEICKLLVPSGRSWGVTIGRPPGARAEPPLHTTTRTSEEEAQKTHSTAFAKEKCFSLKGDMNGITEGQCLCNQSEQ